MTERKGPVLIELDTAAEASPANAPPVPDLGTPLPDGHAMRVVATLGARRPNRLLRLFWAALVGLIGFIASLAAWNMITGLLASNPILGWIAGGLVGLVLLTLLLLALREAAAIARLGRIDSLRQSAEAALANRDIGKARQVAARLDRLYKDRPGLAIGRNNLRKRRDEVFEADSLLSMAETELMTPLDAAAAREVEAAARQVATATALIPLALADIIAALTANLRMIRRVSEIYGGRAGTLGAWRLIRAVMTHLVATGAVAIGDDLIGSALGGSILSKLSRRFGEGVVNGALTARVGVATMEVCRPLPFGEDQRPSVTALVRRALTGLFGSDETS